ncbi:uncharacterized protein [Symphalangus syndactylus]|uniref:uncharacterized protein isoform X3 n=1 Tax=Symphalangus syndactylus TaxID=9590 RepID=UPI0030069593
MFLMVASNACGCCLRESSDEGKTLTSVWHCSLLPPYEEGRVCFPFLHDCKFPEASPAMLNCHITRTRDPLNGEAKRAVTQTSLKHVPCLPGCGRRKGEKSCGPSGIPDLGAPQARAVIPSLGSCGSWHLQDSRCHCIP